MRDDSQGPGIPQAAGIWYDARMANPRLFRVIDHAVERYDMIEEGDRILVGASGGKDSTALVEYLGSRLARRSGPRFTFLALHVESGIGSPIRPDLVARFAEWGVSLEALRVDVMGRLKPGKKMNCWWCSTQRRGALNDYAIENGFNKIALGHHLDDILETAIMNALVKGELSTMPPRLAYDRYPVTIIRPLALADVAMIERHADERGYVRMTCTCDFQDNSGRKDARRKLAALTDGRYEEKRKLFDALSRVNARYLP